MSNKSVLVADDDQLIREVVRRAFEREGFRCDVAMDGVAASNLLKQRTYDVLLSDLRMPRQHGHHLIVEALEHYPNMMILAMTGVTEPRIVADLIARGVEDVISKPFEPELLAVKVRALLERRGTGRAGVTAHQGVALAGQIDAATAALQDRLDEITRSFQATITTLTEQKKELEEELRSSVRVLTNLMRLGSNFDESHAGRVEKMAEAIGVAMRIPQQLKFELAVAALLHDVGQFALPDRIRQKPPAMLDAEERAIYQRYPLISAAVLSEIPGGEPIVELVESHAENYDGSGFPAGKRGEEVSLASRIVRIADGSDTFRMNSEEKDWVRAIHDHLRDMSGRYYDPQLIRPAMAYFEELARKEEKAGTVIMRPEALRPGLVLAAHLYDGEGRFLARKGAVLTSGMITRLQHLLDDRNVPVQAPDQEKAG